MEVPAGGRVIVAGYNAVGASVVRELLASGRSVALIVGSRDELDRAAPLAEGGQVTVVSGEASRPEVLARAGGAGASALVLAAEDDSANLLAALSARGAFPELRIIVSLHRSELRKTLQAAGVTFVVSPQDLGGRICASAAFRPDVVQALEDLTTSAFGTDLREYRVLPGTPLAGQSLPGVEQQVRQISDCLVVGVALPAGRSQAGPGELHPVLNPPRSTQVSAGALLLILGRLENLERFERWYGHPPGR